MNDQRASASLRVRDVPGPDAEWEEIARFGRTFNGYRHWGSFERCAEIANAPRRSAESLDELRTRLFFELRRWHHYGSVPDAEAMNYMRELVDGIRQMAAETESNR